MRSIVCALLFSCAVFAQRPAAETLDLWIASQGGSVHKSAAGEIDEVDLTSTWVTDADMLRLAQITGLRKLTLAHTKITDVGLEHLKPLREVRELDCYYAEYLTSDGIAHLKDWKNLERLNLRGTKLTSKALDYIAGFVNLRALDVAFTEVDDDGFENLTNLPHVESLAFGGNRMTGAVFNAVKLLPSLKHLDAGGIQRADSGLWGLPLTEANLDQIASLKTLETLNLNGGTLADRGLDRPGQPEAERTELRGIGKLAALANLRVLDLSRTPVSNEGIAALAKLGNLRELRLGLARNIDDGAVAAIARLPRIEALYLTETGVTETALDALEDVRSLKVLGVGGTKIGPEAVARFRKARPDCVVTWWRRPT